MKKNLLFILFVFLFCSNLHSQNIKTLLDKALMSKDSSDYYFKKAKKKIKTLNDEVIYFSLKSEFCCNNKKLDSGIVYGTIAIHKIKKLEFPLCVQLLYPVYKNVSQAYRRQGKYEKAIALIFIGLKQAETHKNKEWIIIFNNLISLNYHDFENYQLGVNYGKKALKLAESYPEIKFEDLRKVLNGIAINYDDWNKPDSALYYHFKAIKFAKKNKDTLNLTQTYNNIGNTLLKQKKMHEARKWLLISNRITDFKFSGKFKDFGFYYEKATVINNLATIAFKLNEYSNAEILFDSSYYYAENSKNAEKMRDYYDLRSQFNKKKGDYKKTVYYQDKYIQLRDSVFLSERDENFAELEAKYQNEKKEKELSNSKAQIIQKNLENKQKNNQLIIASLLAIGSLIIGFLFYRQQKLKNTQQTQEFKLKSAIEKIETQNKLQEQRLSISRDLHDNIGSQLTFIISSVDNIKYGFDITNLKLDNKLTNISSFAKDTILELRDTIWAMNSNEITYEDLEIRITNFIDKAKLSQEKISFSFAIDNNLKNVKLTSVEGMNVYRTIQEAVNNSLKYANPEIVSVNIKNTENQTKITISDNGIGFNLQTNEKGNGLNNMKKRIEEIGGQFKLTSSSEGTKIEILI